VASILASILSLLIFISAFTVCASTCNMGPNSSRMSFHAPARVFWRSFARVQIDVFSAYKYTCVLSISSASSLVDKQQDVYHPLFDIHLKIRPDVVYWCSIFS
jgi:CBS domain containing-hemolysin-like protein